MPTTENRTPTDPAPRRRMLIELLALDLSSCGRCTRTDANLAASLRSVAGVFREAGVEARVERRVITTAEEAERFRFVSSPTIRVDGRDVALELRESRCDDCGELCGCGGGVACRVWVWRGREHLEAPREMIVDALLRAYAGAGDPPPPEPAPYELPGNLRAYFAAAAAQDACGPATRDCCDLAACCEPAAREACCGGGPEQPRGACGCR